MPEIDPTLLIHSGNSTIGVIPEESSVRHFELMKEDYVRLVFKSAEPINIHVGDYIDFANTAYFSWGRFYVTEKQRPTYDQNTGGYNYDIQFNAPHYLWNNRIYKCYNEATWSLTDNLANHMAVFMRNLTANGWSYTLTIETYNESPFDPDRHINLQFDNTYMLDALTQICEAFGCEWWITDNIIHLGKAGNESRKTRVQFTVGGNVESMACEKASTTNITRFYAFGSSQNIPSNYRRGEEQTMQNGVVQKRLMLPAGTPYVDIEEGLPDEEVIEGIVFFDDVKAKIDAKVSEVIVDQRTMEAVETNIEVGGSTVVTEAEEGQTEQVNIYRIKTSDFQFSSDYILPGQTLQIYFASGSLRGMTFDVEFNPDRVADETSAAAQVFEIVRNNTYGIYLPNDTLHPSAGDSTANPIVQGDSFVLLGWDVTKMESGLDLLTAAENDLLAKTQQYVQNLRIDGSTYPCTMMSDYMYGLDNSNPPQQDANFSKVGSFNLGDPITLVNPLYFDSNRDSRVVGFEYKIDLPYDSPIIYVGESATYSRRKSSEGRINASLDSVNFRGGQYNSTGVFGGGAGVYIISTNDTTPASESNVYSALRSDRQYARKNRNDDISALWTFQHGDRRGIQSRDYTNSHNEDNLFGKGFEVVEYQKDGQRRARIETDELLVRMKAFFASLEIREISYLGGNYAFSCAGSKIYFVEKYDANDNLLNAAVPASSVAYFRCYMYSDDGTTATINKWALNDQALCQTFNIDEEGAYENASNKRYWRLVVGKGKDTIVEKVAAGDETEYQYVDLSNVIGEYELGSDVPEADDAIAQVGNQSDTNRQGMIYLDLESNNAPAIFVYAGIHTFELPDPKIMLSPKRNVLYGEFHSVVEGTGNSSTIEDQFADLIGRLNDIKNQADQKFDIWFGEGTPLPNEDSPNATANYPASEWDTDALKALHAQDLYYDMEREAAQDGGRCWRWIAVEGSGGSVSYYWEDVTDADTLASLEKISDVASDGKLTGGAEKTRVYIDWMKVVQEYGKYEEQARDYELSSASSYTAYVAAFTALATMLNGGTTPTAAILNGTTAPAWLSNLLTTTVIGDGTPQAAQTYRDTWNAYYTALAALLTAIQNKTMEVAEDALDAISAMADDGALVPSEKLTVKREFLASYHEMNDTDDYGGNYPAGILDKARDNNGNYIIGDTIITAYIAAFVNVGRFLNGEDITETADASSWAIPQASGHSKLELVDSDLPEWIQEDNISNTEAIDGDDWRSVWEKFYSARTAVLTALSKKAHDRIDDIVSDGILNGGDEKSGVLIDWIRAVKEHAKYYELGNSYFPATINGSANAAHSYVSNYHTAFIKLAIMLNDGDPEDSSTLSTFTTAWGETSTPHSDEYNILHGDDDPAWLDSTHLYTDTEIDDADDYRSVWNNYHQYFSALVKAISDKAKEQTEYAHDRIDDVVSDGMIDAGKEKSDLFIQWMEVVANYKKYKERVNDYNTGLQTTDDDYIDLTLLANAMKNVAYILNKCQSITTGTPADYYIEGTVVPNMFYSSSTNWEPLQEQCDICEISINPSNFFGSSFQTFVTNNATVDGSTKYLNPTIFREAWKVLYNELAVIVDKVNKRAKDIATDAQETAEAASEAIDQITEDGWLTGDEIPSLKREFEAAYRRLAKNIDLATYDDSPYGIIDSDLDDFVQDYIDAFEDLAGYMMMVANGEWDAPHTGGAAYSIDTTNMRYHVVAKIPLTDTTSSSDFPTMLQSEVPIQFRASWPSGTLDKGKKFRDLWADLSEKETALLNAMASLTNEKVEDAHVQYFVSDTLPTPPYKAGDLWLSDSYGYTLICVNGKTAGQTASITDWKLTEGEESIIIKFSEAVYNANKTYIKGRSLNQYLKITFGSEPSSPSAREYWYNYTYLYQRNSANTSWSNINNASLVTAFDLASLCLRDKSIKAFNRTPSTVTPNDFDLILRPLIASDPANEEDDIDVGLAISMYKNYEWVVLRESVAAAIENLGSYIRLIVFGDDTKTLSTSGMVVASNFVDIFTQAEFEDEEGNTHTLAGLIGLSVHNNEYTLAQINADRINFKTGDFQITNEDDEKTFGVDGDGNVFVKGVVNTTYDEIDINSRSTFNLQYEYDEDDFNHQHTEGFETIPQKLVIRAGSGAWLKAGSTGTINLSQYDHTKNRINIVLPDASLYKGMQIEIFLTGFDNGVTGDGCWNLSPCFHIVPPYRLTYTYDDDGEEKESIVEPTSGDSRLAIYDALWGGYYSSILPNGDYVPHVDVQSNYYQRVVKRWKVRLLSIPQEVSGQTIYDDEDNIIGYYDAVYYRWAVLEMTDAYGTPATSP